MRTPKAACSPRATRPHDGAVAARVSTDVPNSTKPRRATHACGTPCAADSLVVCDTQE